MRFADGGVAASELVVEDHSTFVGERLVRFHVVPGGARAAMKAQQRQRVRRRGFPDAAIPGLVAGKVHVALGGLIAHLESSRTTVTLVKRSRVLRDAREIQSRDPSR